MYYYMDMPFNSIDDVPDFGSIKMFYVGEPNLGYSNNKGNKIRKYILLSNDIEKLNLINNASDGSKAMIADTGQIYIYCSNAWIEWKNSNESLGFLS